jgi:hypothetical protein
MPAKAAASAATAASTGIRCLGDQGNGQEQYRGGDNAPAQTSLAELGRFQYRCLRQQREWLTVFI